MNRATYQFKWRKPSLKVPGWTEGFFSKDQQIKWKLKKMNNHHVFMNIKIRLVIILYLRKVNFECNGIGSNGIVSV